MTSSNDNAPGDGFPSALVSAHDFAAELDSGTPAVLLDVRWTLAEGSQPDAYREGHLPGAVFVDLETELAGPAGDGGRHPLPSVEGLTATVQRVGAAPGRSVVVYDAGDGAPLAAARAWWCLRYVGLTDVRVLDGGLAAWREMGGPVESGDVAPTYDPHAAARPGGMPVLSADDITAGGVRLVDVRTPERFSGQSEPIDPVAGHIPQAVNVPVSEVVDEGGRVRPADEVRTALGDALKAGDGPLGTYCGSGITAAVMVLALHEGGVDAALYPGSWSEWIRDPERPVAPDGPAGLTRGRPEG